MASTTSLLTGLSGLNANARRLEVIGNNISNVNTTAFKSNRMLFAPALSRNLSLGTSPSAVSGGTNPGQVGLGVTIAGTQRNFNNGAISRTGVDTDLAIEGDGFFVVSRGDEQLYTRAGAFQLNSANEMVTISGERVQGFLVDDTFNIIEGRLDTLNIPLGSLTLAEATRNVNFAGNLNPDLDGLPTQGATLTLAPVFNDFATSTPFASTAGLIADIEDPASPGARLFPPGDFPIEMEITGAMRGNSTLPDTTITLSAATTIAGFAEIMNDYFAIPDGLTNPDGATTGAQYNPGTGAFTIVGPIGEDNNLMFDQSNMTLTNAAGATIANPFTVTQDGVTGVATGESVRTTFIAFDSLGTPIEVDLTLSFESADATGTTWRYFIDSRDNLDLTNPDANVATGTIQFDTTGQIATTSPITVAIQRDNTGAVDPLVFNLNFSSESDNVTALVDDNSIIGATFQDGTRLGTLSTFSVGEDGVISGAFTNGLTRVIGQVAMAKFTNPEGLVDAGQNLFSVGPNSGTALITTPQQFGTGRVIGGALELSNVDLGEEFTNLILTTTGYSAASRVIQSTDQLLQLLVSLGG